MEQKSHTDKYLKTKLHKILKRHLTKTLGLGTYRADLPSRHHELNKHTELISGTRQQDSSLSSPPSPPQPPSLSLFPSVSIPLTPCPPLFYPCFPLLLVTNQQTFKMSTNSNHFNLKSKSSERCEHMNAHTPTWTIKPTQAHAPPPSTHTHI